MNNLSRFVSIIASVVIAIANVNISSAFAHNNSEMDAGFNSNSIVINDGIFETDEQYTARTGKKISTFSSNEIKALTETNTIPSSFDISSNSATQPYFPPVGNQGSINSCAGWATTYYQFTYEVNKMRGTPINSDNSNVFSPAFTYNYINGGGNRATYLSDAYDVLEKHGAMTLQDYPHNNTNYSFAWPTDEGKLVEALEYRAKSSTLNVSSTSSTNFDAVKAMISNGHIGVIWINPTNSFLGWGTTSSGDVCIVRRAVNSDGGHFMAVVGYDDNITISAGSETLTGAFKLVNSWGTGSYNNGYVWVAYDALNSTSVHEANWNYPGTRTQVFGNNNPFYFMTVKDCNVEFAGIVSLASNDIWNVKFYGDKGNSASTLQWGSTRYGTIHPSYANYKIAFDFFDYNTTPVLSNCMSSLWTFKTTGNSSYNTQNIKYKIVDNMDQKIAPNYNINGNIGSSGQFTTSIYVSLAKGRVTAYDNANITSEDSLAVLQYIVEILDFSNLQVYLADYNNDGVVSIIDVIAMNGDIAAQNGDSYSLDDYIDEWGFALSDVIESKYNITLDDFIQENYQALAELGIIDSESSYGCKGVTRHEN